MAWTAAEASVIARSPDGSLIAVHPLPPSRGVVAAAGSGGRFVRIYDGSVSSGSLKFTLRVPTPPPAATVAVGPMGGEGEVALLRKIVFGGDGVSLCGMAARSSTILIWDLDRGVLAKTVDVRGSSTDDGAKKKKKRRSSYGEGREILCDVAAAGDRLFALVLLPDDGGENQGDGTVGGKCRVYEYDLSADGGGALVRKIKVGSVAFESTGEPWLKENALGIAVSNETMVVCMGHIVRVVDLASGGRLCKAEIPKEVLPTKLSSGKEDGGVDSPPAPLVVTPDGRHIAVGIGNHAVLFSCITDDDGSDNKKSSLKATAVLSARDDAPIAHLDLTIRGAKVGDELALLAFQPMSGMASLFAIPAMDCGPLPPPRSPRTRLKTSEEESAPALVHAGFHPRRPGEALLLLFRRARTKSGSAAGSGTSLPMELFPYVDNDGDLVDGTVTVGVSLVLGDGKDGKGKKRRSPDTIAMAPGDWGGEASAATDLSLGKKKTRAEEGAVEDDGEDEFNDLKERGEQEQSIAERLSLMSRAMEQTDEEDDDNEDDDEGDRPLAAASSVRIFKPRSATPDTLTALLTQALSSNDSRQLNTALQVTDRRLVEATVTSLQSLDAERATSDDDGTSTRYVPALVAHVVRRVARRPALTASLGPWVAAVLAATARALVSSANDPLLDDGGAAERLAREGREMASKLGPLRSFLDERVECLPQLLRLEGRLALLGRRF